MKRLAVFVVFALVASLLMIPASAGPLLPERRVAEIVQSPFAGAYEGNAANDPETTFPGDEIIVPILMDGFKNADGADIQWSEEHKPRANSPLDLGPTVQQLKQNQVRPYISIAKGKEVIRDYEFVDYTPTVSMRAQAALRIRFVEDLVSTSEVEYQFRIYLVHKGNQFDTNETFGGMISNPVLEVYEKDYVNLEHGDIAHSYLSAEDIRVGAGNGVVMVTDFIYGEKYYAKAKLVPNEAQNVILRRYPQITDVYELKTVNMKTHGDVVEFTRYQDEPHYVYNHLGNFIGLTTDRLPYSSTYYISPIYVQINLSEEDLALLNEELEDEYPPPFPSQSLDRFTAGITNDPYTEAPAD